jgi:hypothetical protein
MIARALVVSAALAAGCHVPVSTATPQRPTTSGAGGWSVAGQLEAPVVDMLATVASEPSAATPNRYPWAEFPAFELEVAYGASERLDVEVGVQGGLYFVVPIPHAAFAGVRHHAYAGRRHDVGWFARAGYGGFLAFWNEVPYDGSRVRVAYGSTGAAWRMTWRAVRPGLSLAAHPMRVTPDIAGPAVDDFLALGTTATLSVDYRAVTPFVSGGLIVSEHARGNAPVLSAGLAWRL